MAVLRGGPSADVLFEGRSARRNEIFDDERVFAVPRNKPFYDAVPAAHPRSVASGQCGLNEPATRERRLGW